MSGATGTDGGQQGATVGEAMDTTGGRAVDRTERVDNALLAAGAVLPLDAGAGGGTPDAKAPRGAARSRAGRSAGPGAREGGAGDVLTARSFVHPALEGRTVVRLVPESIGPAEDLALEYLGFEPTSTEPVGRVRRQSLGFPAWALVHDPKNGHHALAVVKEMERLTRLVPTKPGQAKDGFDEIGSRLDRSVPQFLPTYYEQVARLFLAAEAQQTASTFFGKARAAEQRHALPVDEERLREVFLEFAGAGALSGKVLREYAKGLAERLPAERAFEEFRTVCSQRCASGLTPYAGMLEDLRRLAKAAGQDALTVERSLVKEIVDTDAVNRAAGGFWRSALPALKVLAAEDEAVRRRLLALLPQTGGDSPETFDASWLALLKTCGAVDLLLDGTVPAAQWLSAWAEHRQRGWQATARIADELVLVEGLADRLVADGVPVRLVRSGWRVSVDLDVLDLCLALGVPVAPPGDDVESLDLESWLTGAEAGRRDLAALAADPRFAPLLRAGLENLTRGRSSTARLQQIADHPVLRTVLVGWFDDRADELAEPIGLPGIEELLQRLLPFAHAPVLATAPQALARIGSFSPAAALGRTLRAGVWDELGWPALEEAVAELGAPAPPDEHTGHGHRDDWYRMMDAWPGLIVRLGMQAVLVGAEKVVDRLTISLPSSKKYGWDTPDVRHIGGQWLTVSGVGDDRRARWSGRPAEVFAPDGMVTDRYVSYQHPSLELADGSRTFGARPIFPGDTSFAQEWRAIAFDGVSLWVFHEGQWWDYDPETARRGRVSVPSFFDSALGTGGSLMEQYCRLLPVPSGFEGSPFGTRDGLLGWWVRSEPNSGTATACSVDGSSTSAAVTKRSTRFSYRTEAVPMPPMRLPAGAVLHPLETRGQRTRIEFRDDQGLLLSSVVEGSWGGAYAAGTMAVPPVAYWHALRPRDEAGSAALRKVTDTEAGKLVAAVVGGAPAQDAVRELLPLVSHPGLVAGVASFVEQSAKFARRVTELAERAEKGRRAQSAAPSAAARTEHAFDGLLQKALDGLVDTGRVYRYYSGDDRTATAMTQVDLVRRTLGGEEAGGEEVFDTHVGWLTLVGPGVVAAAVRAGASQLPAGERAGLLELLDAVLKVRAEGDAVLVDPRGRLRTVHLKALKSGTFTKMLGEVQQDGARRLVFLDRRYAGDDLAHWHCLEYDPTGAFGAWDGFAVVESDVLGAPDDPLRADAVGRMVAAVREQGPLPYLTEPIERFATATGTNPAVGALLTLGLPGITDSGRDGLLSAEYLAPLGLKSADAKAARGVLNGLVPRERQHYTSLLLPLEPERVDELWRAGLDTEALASAWVAARGKQRTVPPWLTGRAVAELGPASLLDRTLNPEVQPELIGRTEQKLDKDEALVPVERDKLLTGTDLGAYVTTLRWLAYRLPFGDPLREVLPVALRMLRERLRDPGLLLHLAVDWDAEGNATSKRLREAHGVGARPEDAKGFVELGDALVLSPKQYYSGWEDVWVRPAALMAAADAAPGADHPAVQLLLGTAGERPQLMALRALLSPEFEALVTADGVPGAAQCPAIGAPELVGAAVQELGLGEDAAALYLMLLALPDPTDRNQAEWTGWKPARLKKARAELAATDLVVEAKRARAGRSLFLPGGWLEAKAPKLPVETWKTTLLPWQGAGFVVPEVAVAALYAAAWQRVVAGDPPGFEEFKGRKSRGGSR
ncbi:hypothetical protein ACH41E_29830 [Streptomyces sp. NPDC020412]|uniref:hypothetical protein n=1 Tax=Streptomyces sp. NPDC020412 TaxID=3365073 RepID=UPI00378E1E49